MLSSILPAVVVLGLLIFLHELGHFAVAKWSGVMVQRFSLGFGPELVGFNDRHGTRWKISAVPLGGYVKFFGDDTEASTPSAETLANMTEEERAGSFHHKKVGPRAAIVAAGPIANFLLAAVIFAAMTLYYGKPSTTPRVDAIQPGSVAAAAGFKVGDVVKSIDGGAIETFADMQRIVSSSATSFSSRVMVSVRISTVFCSSSLRVWTSKTSSSPPGLTQTWPTAGPRKESNSKKYCR